MKKNRVYEIIKEELIRLIELSILDKAEDIAQQAHLHQYRKYGGKKPYIIHPKRVQLLAKTLKYGIDVQIVALLHDVIEDAKNKNYFYDIIKSKFGSTILNSILLLTHDKDVPYNKYLENLAKSNSPIAKLAFKVKMLDILDNLIDSPSNSQKLKYKNAIENLISLGISKNIPKQIIKLLGINETKILRNKIQEAQKLKKNNEIDDIDNKSKINNNFNVDDSNNNDKNNNDDDIFKDIDINFEKSNIKTKDDFDMNNNKDIEDNNNDSDADVDADADADDDGNDDDKLSVVKFNNKLKKAKKINKQKISPEPGFDFNEENDFYNNNYVAKTPKGSLLIAVPAIENNNDMKLDFIKNTVLPKIIKAVYKAIKSDKEVVMLGDYGLPYYNGKYSNSISGFIAKILNNKFKDMIKFDTWNPKDYYSFISNTEIWKDLKERTKAKSEEIKAALYLFLLYTGREKENVIKKLKTDSVNEILVQWGFFDADPNMQINKEKILKLIFPDIYNNAETKASYIIKTYLQLLRVYMLKKVIQYEKDNKIVIIPVDANTAWSLNNSFKKLDLIQKKIKKSSYKKIKVS